MNEFTYSYPVKVYFGEKSAARNLPAELSKVGQNILLRMRYIKMIVTISA